MPDQQPDFKTTTTPLDGVVSMSKPTQPKIDWAALAMHAQGALNAQAQVEAQQRALIQQQQTWAQWAGNQGGRIGGGIAGGQTGAMVGTALGGPGFGTALGGLAGIAIGAAVGDDWAQGREIQQGVRDQRNPLETLAAGVTAPLPGGMIARGGRLLPAIGKAIVTAQPANLASSLALQGAEGNGFSAGRTVRDMAGSTGLQVGIGTGLRAAQRAPMAATRVAQSPAVQHLLASETGAVGPNIRQVPPGDFKPKQFSSGPTHSALANPNESLTEYTFRRSGGRTTIDGRLFDEYDAAGGRFFDLDGETGYLDPDVYEANQADLYAPGAPEVFPDIVVPKAQEQPTTKLLPPQGVAADDTPQFRAPKGGAAPARMAEDVERHIATLKRLGQEDGAINESVYFHTQVADDPMAQAQRGITEPQAATLARAEAIRKSGVFEVPTGRASQMKFSVDDAAAMRKEYAVREEFLSRLREQVPSDLRARLATGDMEAAASVRDLSTKYGVVGIDGLERLKQETALAALEASIADKNIGTAQGRGLALRRARISLTNVPDADFLRLATEKGLPVNEALQVLDELDDPAARLLALRKLANPTAQDKIRQVIFTSLLSVPVTHGVNVLSSTASIIARELLRSTVVTGTDRLASGAGARQIANAPLNITAKAYWQGMKMGAETGWFMLTKGYDPSRLADNIDRPLEAFTGKVSGPLMQAPTRALGAADAFMAQPVYWAEVARRSTAKAMNEGLSGPALSTRIEQLMKDHDLDNALVAHVNKYVETVLFKQQPGKGTRFVGQGVKLLDDVGKTLPVPLPLGTMLVPFRGTPASILRQGFKIAGGGLKTGRTAFREGDNAQGAQDVAEAVIGLGLLSALMMNFADGTLGVVGQLPENEFERGSAYKVGQKPWSLRVGDRHIPAASLGPLAIPISMAAAYTEAFKRDPKRPAMEPFSQIIAPGLSVMLDSTMLKSGSDFLAALRDKRASDKVTGRFATMLIPYAGALRTVRDKMDPILREPGGKGATARFGEASGVLGTAQSLGRNVQEEVEASLPYLSENVRPRFDSFGAPIERPAASARIIGTDPGTDPVGQELIRLKGAFPSFEDDALYPGNMDAALTEMENSVRKEAAKGLSKDKLPALESFLFTDQERNTYKMVVGGLIGDTLAAVIAHPQYAAMSDEQKADVIRNERNRARKMGAQLFREIAAPTVSPRLQGLIQ